MKVLILNFYLIIKCGKDVVTSPNGCDDYIHSHNVNASIEYIENATHFDELPKPKYTTLTISKCMRGVGGDNSWGDPVHKKYEIETGKTYSLRFLIRHI